MFACVFCFRAYRTFTAGRIGNTAARPGPTPRLERRQRCYLRRWHPVQLDVQQSAQQNGRLSGRRYRGSGPHRHPRRRPRGNHWTCCTCPRNHISVVKIAKWSFFIRFAHCVTWRRVTRRLKWRKTQWGSAVDCRSLSAYCSLLLAGPWSKVIALFMLMTTFSYFWLRFLWTKGLT